MDKIYSLLIELINDLKKDTKYFVYGRSELGSDLIAFELGSGERKILVQGSIHGREYINSFLLINIIKYLKKFTLNGRVIIVPLSNPDGVRICLEGYNFIEDENRREIVKGILETSSQKLYKANANGVDLNVNFDAKWGEGASNTNSGPSFQNYIGPYPNSESEVRALINLTQDTSPFLTLSYHSRGEVIYYGFEGQKENTIRDQKKYLDVIVNTTKYTPIYTRNSTGGYKDYCLLKLGILSFTIETGADYLSHPIGLQNLDKIFNQNKDLIINLLEVK